jgi:hypothetical protein
LGRVLSGPDLSLQMPKIFPGTQTRISHFDVYFQLEFDHKPLIMHVSVLTIVITALSTLTVTVFAGLLLDYFRKPRRPRSLTA